MRTTSNNSPSDPRKVKTPQFIDLDRRFHQVLKQAKSEDVALDSYLLAGLPDDWTSGWGRLLDERLSVVLGEPGSGKSIEFRLRAQNLRLQGQLAFYVSLERLVHESWLTVLGSRDQADLEAWRQGNQQAWFFFDSVDESKLRKPDDFLTAVDKISQAIGARELRRAHLFFSSRISEWRPETDGAELRNRFSVPMETDSPEGEGAKNVYRLEAMEGRARMRHRERQEAKAESPAIFALVPLDRERVRRYAQWHGVPDAEQFITALDEHHAWEFARRPLDVNGLINYWRQYGKLGDLTALIEHTITLSLRETEARESLDPLTPQTARSGAEALAAAAVLSRNPNFRVPDDAYMPTSSAIDAADCLPVTWTPPERRALLARALFDGATYGCIRFHHRRTSEYLAASWLERRVHDGCPLDQLEDLFFAEERGEQILRPTLAPVAPWLANGDEPHHRYVRERLLQVAPGIFLKHGDPERLSSDYKRQVLHALADRYAHRPRSWLERDPETLARLSDPSLAPDLVRIIGDGQIAPSLRAEMLLVVRYGRLTACLEAALERVADPTDLEEIRLYAARTLGECADLPLRTRLADVARTLPTLSDRLTGILSEVLYPQIIGADDLIALLRKTEPPTGSSVDLSWTLGPHLEGALTSHSTPPLLKGLLELLGTPPFRERGTHDVQISERYGWTCDLIPIVVCALLKDGSPTAETAQLVAQGLQILRSHWIYGERDKNEARSLADAVCRHPMVKRAYFWQGVELFRARNGREPSGSIQVLGFSSPVTPDPSDGFWLVADARERTTVRDRALATRFALELWQPYGFQWGPWWALLRAQFALPELRRLFWRCTWQQVSLPVRGVWYRQIASKLLSEFWWQRQLSSLQRALTWMRDEYRLHRHLRSVYSGKFLGWLMNLSREAGAQQDRWGGSDWSQLRKKRGPLVAWAARHGCVAVWQRHTLLLPHERPTPNETPVETIVGLCGLQSLWEAKEIDFGALPAQDADRAVRYALCELNDFAGWLPELAEAQPDAVRRVLKLCVQGEWLFPPDRTHVHEVLSKLLWQGQRYWPLIAPDLLSELRLHDPRHPEVLFTALSILAKGSSSWQGELAALAADRVPRSPVGSPAFPTWVAVWLQLDALAALAYLTQRMAELSSSEADDLMLRVCHAICGHRLEPVPLVTRPDFLTPQAMRLLVPLVYRHIRPQEDIDRTGRGAFTVTARDDVQEFRNGLLQRLAQLDHPDVYVVLSELRELPELAPHRNWIIQLLEEHVHRRGDLPPWPATNVRNFALEYETPPQNENGLFRIACNRLRDIKREVELSENSLRSEVRADWDESLLRQWFQRKLRERARQHYTIPQEAEIDQRQREDLRFENPQISAAIPVEIKWVENWSAAELLAALETQLVGQYLRASNIHYGIYLLAYIGRKERWDHPTESRRIGFGELLSLIETSASHIVQTRSGVAGIHVIAFDFKTP